MMRNPTQEELNFYEKVFNNTQRSENQVPGNVARDLLRRSGLPDRTLADIWKLSDQDRNGMLTKFEFFMAMHLIKVFKETQTLPPSVNFQILSTPAMSMDSCPQISSTVQRPPSSNLQIGSKFLPGGRSESYQFSAVNASPATSFSSFPHSPTPSFSSFDSPTATSMRLGSSYNMMPELQTQIDPLDPSFSGEISTTGKIACREVFDKFESVQNTGKLSGKEAKNFLKRFPLSTDDLRNIWKLSDLDADGCLTISEFILAIYQIQFFTARGFVLPVVTTDLIEASYFSPTDEMALEKARMQQKQEYSEMVMKHINEQKMEALRLLMPVKNSFQSIESEESNLMSHYNSFSTQFEQEKQALANNQHEISSQNEMIGKLRATINSLGQGITTLSGQMMEIRQKGAYQTQASNAFTSISSHYMEKKSQFDNFTMMLDNAKNKMNEKMAELRTKEIEANMLHEQCQNLEIEYRNLCNEINQGRQKKHQEQVMDQRIAIQEQQQMAIEQRRKEQELTEARFTSHYNDQDDTEKDTTKNDQTSFHMRFKSIRNRNPSIYRPKKSFDGRSPSIPDRKNTSYIDSNQSPHASQTIPKLDFNQSVMSENYSTIPNQSNTSILDPGPCYIESGKDVDDPQFDEKIVTFDQPLIGVSINDYFPEDIDQTPVQKDRLLIIYYKMETFYYTGNLDGSRFTWVPEDYVSFDFLSSENAAAILNHIQTFTSAYLAIDNYPEGEAGDLSFVSGDLLHIFSSDESWFFGYLNGSTGLAPGNFLENVSLVDLELYVYKCISDVNFSANHESEIDVNIGDTVIEHWRNPCGWSFGFNENTQNLGWFNIQCSSF